MKDRIIRELGYVLEADEPVGFFSFVVSRSAKGHIVPTVIWICDEATTEQANGISKALLRLFDTLRPLYWADEEARLAQADQNPKGDT